MQCEEQPMITHINESGSARRRDLAEQILRFRDEPIETMREVRDEFSRRDQVA